MSTNFRGLTTSYILLTNQQRTLKSIEQTASKYLKFCLSFTFTRIEDGICFRPVCGVIACKFAQHQNVRQNTALLKRSDSWMMLVLIPDKRYEYDRSYHTRIPLHTYIIIVTNNQKILPTLKLRKTTSN